MDDRRSLHQARAAVNAELLPHAPATNALQPPCRGGGFRPARSRSRALWSWATRRSFGHATAWCSPPAEVQGEGQGKNRIRIAAASRSQIGRGKAAKTLCSSFGKAGIERGGVHVLMPVLLPMKRGKRPTNSRWPRRRPQPDRWVARALIKGAARSRSAVSDRSPRRPGSLPGRQRCILQRFRRMPPSKPYFASG